MIFQPRSFQYPRRRMSPPALLAVLLFHGLLLWLINQHWPIERAVRNVVYQYVRPAAPEAAQEAPASRAITASRSLRAATELSIFAKTTESSVPLKITNQLPELAQAKASKPAPSKPAETPPEPQPTPVEPTPVPTPQTQEAATEPPVPQAAAPVPQAAAPTPVPQPPVVPPPVPEPVPDPVPVVTQAPAPVTVSAPPPVPVPPPVVAPVPVPTPAPAPPPTVVAQPPVPVAPPPEPVAQPAPIAPAGAVAAPAEAPLETMVEQPRATRRLRGPVVDVPVSPNSPATSSVSVPVLVLPPAGVNPGPAPGATAGSSPAPAGGPSVTGPGVRGNGPSGPTGGSGNGPANAGQGPAGRLPSAGLPVPALPSAAMPAVPASRPVANGMPPPPMPGTYRVLPAFRRNLADMANEQLRRGNSPDPLAEAVSGSALPDCTTPQSGTATVGGLMAAPAVAGRLLSGRCR
ncbi:hypothetical protein BH11PSE7_BH11PSE7_09100 [soil metagenome]